MEGLFIIKKMYTKINNRYYYIKFVDRLLRRASCGCCSGTVHVKLAFDHKLLKGTVHCTSFSVHKSISLVCTTSYLCDVRLLLRGNV